MSGEARYRLFVLGRFRVEANGRDLRLHTRKAEALLAYRVLPAAAHMREMLAAVGGAMGLMAFE